jgi:phosphoribosylformylglycinamidine cyclo-ligase
MQTSFYENAGVSGDRSRRFIDYIQRRSPPLTSFHRVAKGIGGFCALYEKDSHSYLAATTDGVGTKVLLAKDLQYYQHLGQDLVAMNVNDLVCSGARPLFFLDYLGCQKLNADWYEPFIDGLVTALSVCSLPLIGGETAEMPSLFSENDFDVAGFCVGEVTKTDLIDGRGIHEGDLLIGLESSGYHANGFSLLRQRLHRLSPLQLKSLLTPTTLYAPHLLTLLKEQPGRIQAMAHITGSGIRNIPRLHPDWHFHLDDWWSDEELPTLYQETKVLWQDLCLRERLETFNMGVGFVLVVHPKDLFVIESFFKRRSLKTKCLGRVLKKRDEKRLTTSFLGENLTFEAK